VGWMRCADCSSDNSKQCNESHVQERQETSNSGHAEGNQLVK
jgi:hypothetical protein